MKKEDFKKNIEILDVTAYKTDWFYIVEIKLLDKNKKIFKKQIIKDYYPNIKDAEYLNEAIKQQIDTYIKQRYSYIYENEELNNIVKEWKTRLF